LKSSPTCLSAGGIYEGGSSSDQTSSKKSLTSISLDLPNVMLHKLHFRKIHLIAWFVFVLSDISQRIIERQFFQSFDELAISSL